MKVAYLGLGSNLDDPTQQLNRAVNSINGEPDMLLQQCSSFYSSQALTWNNNAQPDYVNAVAKITTTLDAESLLNKLQRIENQQGRVRKEKWGARTLDLDILLFAQETYQTERLRIPHPHMLERNFVLYPLFEIEPELNIPSFGVLSTIIKAIPFDGLVKLV